MPNRHFLRRDYLHIFFDLKFLVFVSLVPQIISFSSIRNLQITISMSFVIAFFVLRNQQDIN